MKRNAIVRIVLYSLVVLILSSVLISAILANSFSVRTAANEEHTVSVSVTEAATAPKAEAEPLPAKAADTGNADAFPVVDKIEIDWAAGSITISPENIGDVQVTETVTSGSPRPMVCRVDKGTLKVMYNDEKKLTGLNLGSKDLTILVPMNWMCTELEINAASAVVNLKDLRMGEVEVNTASGNCNITDCNIDSLEVSAASADVYFTGSLREFECEGVSGNAYLTLDAAPRKISMESVSGSMDLTLPKDCGFTLERESLTAKFNCDVETTQRNGHHIYGDGSCQIELEGLSTSLTIHHADSGHHAESHDGDILHLDETHHEEDHHEEDHH